MGTEQQPAAPYSIDSLNVHDKDLIFSREFGTNVDPNLGDAFVTTAAPEADVPATINARTGMLEETSLEGGGSFDEPRGRSFLLPAWDTLPESPFFGPDFRAMVLYCHLLYRDETFGGGGTFVDFILGEDTLIGHAPNTAFVTCSIESSQGQMGPNVSPATVVDSSWSNGPLGPGNDFEGDNWGKEVYWRILALNDPVKGTDLAIQVSQYGLAWTPLGNQLIGDSRELRRIGLSIRGAALGALDWVRAYSWVITGASDDFLIPAPPETGSRLFIS